MPNPVPVSMGRGSKTARQGQGGLALFENFYVEDLGEQGKTSFTAQAINGWGQWANTTETKRSHCMLPVGNLLLAAVGEKLFSIALDGVTVTEVAGIPGNGFITMAANRKTPDPQVAIVRNGLYYLFQAGMLTQGADTDLPPPLVVLEILGYFVFLIQDGRFFVSETNDAGIDPTSYAEAESSVDRNVMGAVRGRTLIIFGERTAEFWDINGNAVFPFGYTAGINMGCYLASSVQNLVVQQGNSASDTVIWAATDRKGAFAGIYMLNGYTPVLISNDRVTRLIRDEPLKSEIWSMAFTEDGHPFYVIGGSTFTETFDGKTNEWHTRSSKNQRFWNATSHAHFGDKVLFGHASNGKIYVSRNDLLDEDGQEITCRIQPPPIHMFPRRFQVPKVYLDVITGVGVNSSVETDANPKMFVDYSKDGGRSWSMQRSFEMGAMANDAKRIKITGLGRFNHNGLTLRASCSARVVKAVQQLAIEAVPLGA